MAAYFKCFVLFLLTGMNSLDLALSQSFEKDVSTAYAFIGNPLRLSCLPDNTRPISSCVWQIALGSPASQGNLLGLTKSTDADLQSGNCTFTIEAVQPRHISTWKCTIIFLERNRADVSDLLFQGQIRVIEAKMPDPPRILQKLDTLLANSLSKAASNNNTVDLSCCTNNGIPPPELSFMLGDELKMEKQLEINQNCIEWVGAVFNLDDNRKTVTCKSTHIATAAAESSQNKDSFVLNILHAPTIIDQDSLDQSITTYIDTITKHTEIVVRFTSNPIGEWSWLGRHSSSSKSYYDVLASDQNGIYEELYLQLDADEYEIRLLIRNAKHRNSKRFYALELKNEFGSAFVEFSVTQIVHKVGANLELGDKEGFITLVDSSKRSHNGTNVSCCIRSGETPPEVSVKLLLGDVVHTNGIIRNDSGDPFCYTWSNLEFDSTADQKNLRCQSGDIQNWIIQAGEDDREESTAIHMNILHGVEITTPMQGKRLTVEYPSTKEVLINFTSNPKASITWYVREGEGSPYPVFYPMEAQHVLNSTSLNQTDGHGQIVLNLENLEELFTSNLKVFKLELSNAYGNESMDTSQLQIHVNIESPTTTLPMVTFSSIAQTPKAEQSTTLNATPSTVPITLFTTELSTASNTPLMTKSVTNEWRTSTSVLLWTVPPTDPTLSPTPLITTEASEKVSPSLPTKRTEVLPVSTTAEESRHYPFITAKSGSWNRIDREFSVVENEVAAMSCCIGNNENSILNLTAFLGNEPLLLLPSPTETELEHSTLSLCINWTIEANRSHNKKAIKCMTNTLMPSGAQIKEVTLRVLHAPTVWEDPEGKSRLVISNSFSEETSIPVKFSANPLGNVSWFLREPNNSYYIIENGSNYEITITESPEGNYMTVLLVKPWVGGPKIADQKKYFHLVLENAYGKEEVRIILLVDESSPKPMKKEDTPNLKTINPGSGVSSQYYIIIGVLAALLSVAGVASIVLYVSKKSSIMCFSKRRGSFIVKQSYNR